MKNPHKCLLLGCLHTPFPMTSDLRDSSFRSQRTVSIELNTGDSYTCSAIPGMTVHRYLSPFLQYGHHQLDSVDDVR